MKHGETFHIGKFVLTITWGAIIGTVLSYYQRTSMLSFQPFEIVLLVFAGIVILDETFQAIFLRSKSGLAASTKTAQDQ